MEDLPADIERGCLSNNGWGRECANYIVVDHNDKRLLVESDAMEPEDARFTRDLRWVADAIREAYSAGRADANSNTI